MREILIEAVEKRFGNVEGILETHVLKFLSDNGTPYIDAETRQIAKQLGLRPVNTPVCSPPSNGMAAPSVFPWFTNTGAWTFNGPSLSAVPRRGDHR